MPNSDSRLDERIRKELKELEAPYNEAHWKEIEPFVNNLAPRSNFKIGSRTILGISLLIVLIVAAYFALPLLNREKTEPAPAIETSSEDTGSTDPNFRPDTISKPAPVSTPPATTVVDTAKLVQDSAIQKPEAPVEKEIKTEPPVEPKPKKKKKKETKKEDTPPAPEPDEGDNDLLKKDVPIIAVPQDEPPKEEPKKEEPITP